MEMYDVCSVNKSEPFQSAMQSRDFLVTCCRCRTALELSKIIVFCIASSKPSLGKERHC